MPLHPDQATLNFSWSELECSCGCGTRAIDPIALTMLQDVRNAINTPLTINSAARCPSWNAEVGGRPASKHLSITGEQYSTAFDISTHNVDANTLVGYAIDKGFKGIGRYDTFVHIDVRNDKARW